MAWNAVFNKWGDIIGIEPAILYRKKQENKEMSKKDEVMIGDVVIGKRKYEEEESLLYAALVTQDNDAIQEGLCVSYIASLDDSEKIEWENCFDELEEFEVIKAYRIPPSLVVRLLKDKARLKEMFNGQEVDVWGRKLQIGPTHTIKINGKEIELSEESYKELKESLV